MENVNPQQPIVIIQTKEPRVPVEKNGLGTAGFVLSLLGLVFCWIPVAGWIIWVLGLALSFTGLFKKPKGLAITGMILSAVSIFVITTLITALIELW